MRFATLLVGASLFLAAAPEASAQPAHLSAQDEANARFQTGLKFYDARDFESARLAFTQAYAVLQKPGILLNLALSELYSNHVLEAIPHFEQYIKDSSTPADKRENARKHLDEAMKKTAHLEIRTSADAEVTLDGRPLAPPYAALVHVLPGSHSLDARLGQRAKQTTIDAKAGDTVAVDLTFDGAAATPPPAATVSSEPPPRSTPPAGPPTRYEATTADESFWGLRSIGGLVLAGVGAGFLVFWGVREHDASTASTRADDLRAGLPRDACFGDAKPPACDELAGTVDDRDTAKSQATVGGIVGITALALGVGAIVSAFIVPHKRSAVAFVPAFSPGRSGGVFVTDF